MSQTLIAIFLVTFSIFVHELGHFLVARWRGLVVPRFSLFGLGKPIVSWKWHGVEYCICWLPIGAYVMIPQLSDVQMGEFEGEVPEEARKLPPGSYLSKVLVALAGPFANLVLAFVLACAVWQMGVRVPAEFNRTEIGEIAQTIENSEGRKVAGPAAAAGLQAGDIISQIDGKPVSTFQDIAVAIAFGDNVAPDGRRVAHLTLERNGATITRDVFPELVGTDGIRNIGIGPKINANLQIEKVNPGSPAEKAGLLPGDRFVALNGKPLEARTELSEYFQKNPQEMATLTYKRGDTVLTTRLQPRLDKINGQEVYLIGVVWRFETVLIKKSPLAQFQEAYAQMYQIATSLFNRRSDIGVRHMSGIVGIVDNLQQVASAGVASTLAFLVLINISLATLNLLPIPVLDGGHILFATLAKIRGRPLNPVLMQNAVAACFVMLLGLIVYVSYHDIRRVVENHLDNSPPAAAKPAQPGK